jgi:hypothetical protein
MNRKERRAAKAQQKISVELRVVPDGVGGYFSIIKLPEWYHVFHSLCPPSSESFQNFLDWINQEPSPVRLITRTKTVEEAVKSCNDYNDYRSGLTSDWTTPPEAGPISQENVMTMKSEPQSEPLFNMSTDGICHIYTNNNYDHHGYFGLAICDLVRHVAKAFSVSEEKVWYWVDKERTNPTAPIEGKRLGNITLSH